MAGKSPEVQLRYLEFLGGEVLVNPDNEQLALPVDATCVEIDAEGGPAYYAINQTGAGTGSHGYVPEEGGRWLGPMSNLHRVDVHAPAATLHILYFKEH